MIDFIPEHLRAKVLRALACVLRVSLSEGMSIQGIIKIREYPRGAEIADWAPWWWSLDEAGRERYTLAESHNLITSSGRTSALSYIGNSSAVVTGFAQYFAVGTLATNLISGGDTLVGNEIYRQVPNTTAITGTQIDIATVIGTNTAAGSWTNGGLFGGAATSSTGTGTLNTHSLMNYTKVNGTPVTVDYLISLT